MGAGRVVMRERAYSALEASFSVRRVWGAYLRARVSVRRARAGDVDAYDLALEAAGVAWRAYVATREAFVASPVGNAPCGRHLAGDLERRVDAGAVAAPPLLP